MTKNGIKIGSGIIWACLVLVILFLYVPLLPPFFYSVSNIENGNFFQHYTAIIEDVRLMQALRTSLVVGLLTTVITPLIALIAAEAVRVFRIPRLIIGIMLIPLFVPGISMGVATALFFQILGIPPSILTITAVQVLWALPFAFLIILTVLSTFDQIYLEAAYMSGSGRLRAFFEIELPQIHPGIVGAAVFSLIISFNETIRTAVVQGGGNTIPTYLWSQYQQVGLSPTLYALMVVLTVTTLLLIATLAVLDHRQRRI